MGEVIELRKSEKDGSGLYWNTTSGAAMLCTACKRPVMKLFRIGIDFWNVSHGRFVHREYHICSKKCRDKQLTRMKRDSDDLIDAGEIRDVYITVPVDGKWATKEEYIG